MKDAVQRLDAEIESLEGRLAGLRYARELLARDAPARKQAKAPLLLEGPKPKGRQTGKRKAAAPGEPEPVIFEINDVNVEMTQIEFDVCKALVDAEAEWRRGADLATATCHSYSAVLKAIVSLRTKLVPAKAKIESQRSAGFRLVSAEDGE